MDQLSLLLRSLAHYEWVRPPKEDIVVEGIALDSRQVVPGGLFVAITGSRVDGHQFIPQAIEKGARVLVVERWEDINDIELHPEVAVVRVPDTRVSVGRLADAFYGHPSQRMKIVGITGTNGKTTVATLSAQAMQHLGRMAATIGTLGIWWPGNQLHTINTTPDPVTLHSTMAQMVEDGVEFVFMEVSSHALNQYRIEAIQFQGAVFTNITRDHLDYHSTMKDYIFTKKRLFDGLSAHTFALVNADDRRHGVMVQNTRAKVFTYALRGMADFAGRLLEHTMDGLLMKVDGQEVHFPLIGSYNAANALAAYGILRLLGVSINEALQGLSVAVGAPGRMEVVCRRPLVVVDYAHTPDALAKAIAALRPIAEGKLWVIFGAGGDRDPGKRPLMGQAATRADRIVLTADNPRSEDPRAIIDQIIQGIDHSYRRHVLIMPDRRQAIENVLNLANPTDVVLIAGKGHETYQEVNGIRHPFDDREVVRKWFNN